MDVRAALNNEITDLERRTIARVTRRLLSAYEIGPEPPEQVLGSFVDEELRQHHSDVLFRVRLKTGSDAFAYVLLEHKSSSDSGARRRDRRGFPGS